MINLGTVRPGSTIYIPFETFGNATPTPITITGLATSDILVYKNGSTTERASAAGFTLLDTDGIDFDGKTGIHGVSIDLSDNTTSDFWQAGAQYFVVIGDITVDSLTMRFIPVTFRIGYAGAILDTTIATLASQTSFTLTAGPAEDDALNGSVLCIHDIASAVQVAQPIVLDYTGSTRAVTLAAAPTFTIAAGDNVSVMPRTNLYSVNGTPASASGTVDANVVSMAANSLTASAAAADFIAEILTTQMTEAYAADGVAPTLAQAIFLIMQHLSESSISSTTKTVKKLDGTTTAATFTLDSATTPTSITRAT